MHRSSERAVNDDAPVADLVAESLDHDGSIVGHCTRGLRLLVEVHQHVAGGQRVEPVVGGERFGGCLGRERTHLALKRPQRSPQFERPARSIAMPEGHLAGLTGCRAHHHALERDVVDAPRACAQQERLAWTALVHHLFVEFAHACAIGEEHPEQPAVGDGATAGDREPLRAVAGAQCASHPIPDQTRTQLAELFTGVPTR